MDLSNLKNYYSQYVPQAVAIDLGSGNIKLILAEYKLGKIACLQHQIIDLQTAGLISAQEINRHLTEIIDQWGNPPIALAVPQHLSISQVVDLPPASEKEIKALVERETRNLSGLSGSSVLYDYQRLLPFGKHPNPFRITVCRENEILNQISRLYTEGQERCYCEVTTVANALITSYLDFDPRADRIVIADFGSTSTDVAILMHGQGVYTGALPIGDESIINALAALLKCSFEEAVARKRSRNFMVGPDHLPGVVAVVDAWLWDLAKLIKEWEDDNPTLRNPDRSFRIVLCGGGAEQPGLLAYLQEHSVYPFNTWPTTRVENGFLPLHRYAAAYGLLLQVFGETPAPSLLPAPLRLLKQQQQQLMLTNWIGLGMLLVVLLLLLLGSASKISATREKKSLAADATASLSHLHRIEELFRQREREYQKIAPILEHQEATANTLKILQIMQAIRQTNDLWFVLLADRQSYALQPKAGETNPATLMDLAQTANYAECPTNYVAELIIPDKRGDKIKVLSSLVDELQKEPLFGKVDTLADRQRSTNWLDPRQIPLDRYLSLTLELKPREQRADGVGLWRGTNAPAINSGRKAR